MPLKNPVQKAGSWDPISIIKGSMLDMVLLFGSVFSLIIFTIAFTLSPTYLFSLGFYIDLSSIISLFCVYYFRNSIELKLKISVILFFVFMLFVVNIFQYGNTSTQKALVTLIPFLSILIFDIRKTIVMFAITIGFYGVACYLFISKFLAYTPPIPENESISTWLVSMMVTAISGIIIMVLVNRYNSEMLAMVSHLQKTTSQLELRDKQRMELLEEKNIMIQEIHHRVKNNLAVVSGLLELQMKNVDNEKLHLTMQKSVNRIMSIAKVHQMLYQSDDFNNIPFKGYIDELSDVILTNMNSEEKNISFISKIDVEHLSVNHGVPLGIVFNELITNSIKYAFPANSDNQIVIIAYTHNGHIKVSYKDNGIGIADFEEASTKSLGFTLIHSLLTQIDAEYKYDIKNGFCLEFSFPTTT